MDQLRQALRSMVEDARQRFYTRVSLYIETDKDREFAEALQRAIGEISVEEAFTGYLKYKGL